jgi:hypothetical protein
MVGAVHNGFSLSLWLLWWWHCSSSATTIVASSSTPPCRSSAGETSYPSSACGVVFMFRTLRVCQRRWIFSLVVLIWTINGANWWMLARIWTSSDIFSKHFCSLSLRSRNTCLLSVLVYS